jgi:hypothetical protein
MKKGLEVERIAFLLLFLLGQAMQKQPFCKKKACETNFLAKTSCRQICLITSSAPYRKYSSFRRAW